MSSSNGKKWNICAKSSVDVGLSYSNEMQTRHTSKPLSPKLERLGSKSTQNVVVMSATQPTLNRRRWAQQEGALFQREQRLARYRRLPLQSRFLIQVTRWLRPVKRLSEK
jgi:hypothetical protein